MTIRDITYMDEGLIPAPNVGPALRYNPLHKENVTDIAVHHWTGFLPPETWTTGEEIAYIVRIDQYHRIGRGLDGIGYHICCFPSRRVYITARLDKYGAHVGGENDHLIGLALPGTFNLNIPSPKHLEACREAVRYIYEFLDKEVPTTPHLNWPPTTCPGDRWREWVPQLQTAAQEEGDMHITPEERREIANSRDAIVKLKADLAALRTITPEEIREIVNARNKVRDLQVDIERLQGSSGDYTDAQAIKAVKNALPD